MRTFTHNETMFVLNVFKNPETLYNASSISKVIGISRMGALKIARKLEKENTILSKEFGKARFYMLNLNNDFVRQYLCFLLKREAEYSDPYVKMWVSEIRKIKYADLAILFGSVLKRHKSAEDIDVLLVTDKKRFSKLKDELKEIDAVNVKKIHAIYQTKEDFIKNLKKNDKVVLNAIKGVVAFGEEFLIKVVQGEPSKK